MHPEQVGVAMPSPMEEKMKAMSGSPAVRMTMKPTWPGKRFQKNMERSTIFLWGNPLFLWPFSIAMLVITRPGSFRWLHRFWTTCPDAPWCWILFYLHLPPKMAQSCRVKVQLRGASGMGPLWTGDCRGMVVVDMLSQGHRHREWGFQATFGTFLSSNLTYKLKNSIASHGFSIFPAIKPPFSLGDWMIFLDFWLRCTKQTGHRWTSDFSGVELPPKL